MLILEQNTTKKRQVEENQLDIDVSNNVKYKVKAI